MRVFVYGFGQYRNFKDNITQHVVRKLPASRNLKKVVFSVRFDERQFIAALRKHRPDVVLGLGQCSTGRMLRIERRAINKKRNTKNEKPHAITRGGSKWLSTSLKLEKSSWDKQAKMSYDAGDYVCNFSMYVILDYLRRHSPKACFGFIHIPHDYDPKRAAKFVEKILNGRDARS
jgi:pyrrolidone-carboxylate peptidase